MRKCIVIGALVIGVLAACGDDDTERTATPATDPATTQAAVSTTAAGGLAELEGATFAATELTVDGQPRPGADNSTFSLSFANGQVNADFGCNTGSGAYRIEGDVLVVDQLTMTRKGCEGELGEQDALMNDLLTGSPTVQLDADQLTLTSTRIVFDGTKA